MSEKLTMSLETYLETIAELQVKYGAVRTSDLADQIGCKRSSVTNALQRLSEKGLINYQAYRPVTLTDEGKKAIARLSRFHGIIEDFLANILSLPTEFATEEACRLEHNLSRQTIERMKHFSVFIRSRKSDIVPENLPSEFSKYLKSSSE